MYSAQAPQMPGRAARALEALMLSALRRRDCEKVARVLAELMLGGALRFPPGGPNAWNAWSQDTRTQIVVTPRGHFMVPGTTEMEWTARPAQERASETHVALNWRHHFGTQVAPGRSLPSR
jgi:hypothetical protein